MGSTLLMIFALQIIYVTTLTLRQIFTLKGYRYLAALLSSIDIFIYVVGFKIVLDNLRDPLALIVYCASYGLGILLGIRIEEKLALGYVNMQIVTKRGDLAERLRENGYGVTTWKALGIGGENAMLSIIIHRKNQDRLYQTVTGIDPEAFVVAMDAKHFRGGFLMRPLFPVMPERKADNPPPASGRN